MDEDELAALHEYVRTEDASVGGSYHEDEVGHSTVEDDSYDSNEPPQPPPLPHLREISSLASWAVSSYKPGCGVNALRHPSPLYYWQSDGPQPHTLNIHFFKLVSIVHIRIYLNFELDESYTPTRLIFLAGTGHHDLQVVREMDLKQPKGWIDVDLRSAGGPSATEEGVVSDDSDEDSDGLVGMSEEDLRVLERRRAQKKVGTGPCLKCFLVQIFARDSARSRKMGISSTRGSKGVTSVEAKFIRSRCIQRPHIGLEDAEFLNATIR